jgi:hypothetical protein
VVGEVLIAQSPVVLQGAENLAVVAVKLHGIAIGFVCMALIYVNINLCAIFC